MSILKNMVHTYSKVRRGTNGLNFTPFVLLNIVALRLIIRYPEGEWLEPGRVDDPQLLHLCQPSGTRLTAKNKAIT
jgi:hypothetical protein